MPRVLGSVNEGKEVEALTGKNEELVQDLLGDVERGRRDGSRGGGGGGGSSGGGR